MPEQIDLNLSCTSFWVTLSSVLTVPLINALSGIMLCVVPECICVIEITTLSNADKFLELIVCMDCAI